MICEECGGTGFVIVERGGASAARRCACRAAAKQKKTPLTLDDASHAMDLIFEILDFSPASDRARAILVGGFAAMVETQEQAKYVIDSVPQFHTKWGKCGLSGLRQILCRRYTPKDGIVLNTSDSYPEGLPATPLEEGWQPPKLPPGHVVAADHQMDEAVQRAGATKALLPGPELAVSPEQRRRDIEFEKLLEDIETAPQHRDDPPRPTLFKRPRGSAIVRLSQDEEHAPLPEGSYTPVTKQQMDALHKAHTDERKKRDSEEGSSCPSV